jgi:hypothetical protein
VPKKASPVSLLELPARLLPGVEAQPPPLAFPPPAAPAPRGAEGRGGARRTCAEWAQNAQGPKMPKVKFLIFFRLEGG